MASKKLKSTMLPDKYYHIYNRGNNREKLFYHSSDYFFFLEKYKKYIAPFVDTYAFCLLPNHFHFLIKTREEVEMKKSVVPNQLRKLFICYTIRANFFQNRVGGLFTKNYQRIEITNEQYLTQLVKYIHKNPVKHKIQADYQSYLFSSFRIIMSESSTHLNRGDLINWFGGKNEFLQYHEDDLLDPETFNLLNIENDEMDPL
jgi:REP element-mobilizing transposase RayT